MTMTNRPILQRIAFFTALVLAFWLATPVPSESAPSKPHYATPSSVQPWYVGCDSFGVQWKAAPYADFYVMRYSRHSDYRKSSYVRLTSPNVTHAEVEGLSPGTRFYAKVAVSNVEGDRLSSYSKTVSLKTSPPCGSDNDD